MVESENVVTASMDEEMMPRMVSTLSEPMVRAMLAGTYGPMTSPSTATAIAIADRKTDRNHN